MLVFLKKLKKLNFDTIVNLNGKMRFNSLINELNLKQQTLKIIKRLNCEITKNILILPRHHLFFATMSFNESRY